MNRSTTIIILNWNGRKLTANCLRSVLAMQGNYSVIVVDNGSSDGSADFFEREFPQVTVLVQPRNLGFAAGCNVGIQQALSQEADYILLLNNDTITAGDLLAEMQTVIESDERVGMVCPKIFFGQPNNVLWYAGGDFSLWTGTAKHRGWKEIDNGQFEEEAEIGQGTGCAMLVRSAVVRKVGSFDERFWCYAEDLDWSLRFREHGYQLKFAPKAHLWHYEGATSVRAMGSGSQEVRQLFSTRNLVFVGRKHAHWWQVPSYALGFLLNHVVFFTLLRLWQRDFKALGAIYRGVLQGFTTQLDWGEDQPLPGKEGSVSKDTVHQRYSKGCE